MGGYHSGAIKDNGGEFMLNIVSGQPIYGSNKNNGLKSRMHEATDFGLKY